MSKFKPSPASYDQKERTLRALRYAKKAISILEAYVEKMEGDVPAWAMMKIVQGAQSLGSAITYLRNQESRNEDD